MAKSFDQITKQFTKIISECEKRAEELYRSSTFKRDQANQLNKEADEQINEAEKVSKLSSNIENLLK